jgi:hypothetical protein
MPDLMGLQNFDSLSHAGFLDASWTSWLSLAAIFGQHRIFSAQALQSNLEAR